MNDGGFFIGGAFGFFLALGIACAWIGPCAERYERSSWQTECVNRKVAHWEVAVDGTTKFVWDAESTEQDKELAP